MYTWVERKKNRFCLKKIAYLRTYTSEVTCRNFSYIYPVSLISFGQKMSARGLNGCHWRIDFKNKDNLSDVLNPRTREFYKSWRCLYAMQDTLEKNIRYCKLTEYVFFFIFLIVA